MKNIKFKLLSGLFVAVLGFSGIASAAPDTQFTQVINQGALIADVKDENGATVANPAVSMSSVSESSACQATTDGSDGDFGTDTQRLYVDNPGAADGGWSLTVAATDGPTATWTGGTYEMDFNDPEAADDGCTDGGSDADTVAGLMTIDPSAAVVQVDGCQSCTNADVNPGPVAAFDENDGTNGEDLTIVTALADTADFWRGYVTGIKVYQTIPAEQPQDTYTIDLTITATAS